MNPQCFYLCRLCLQKTPTKVYIYNGDFAKMVELLTSVKFREGDGLPKYSCPKCVLDVKQALTTRKRILTTHKTLLECLQKKRKAAMLHKPIVKQKTDPDATGANTVATGDNTVRTEGTTKVIELKVTDVTKLTSNDCISLIKIQKVGGKEAVQVEDNESVQVADKQPVHEKNNTETAQVADKQPVQLENHKSVQEKFEIKSTLTKNRIKVYHCQTCKFTFNDKRLAINHCNLHNKSKCHICDKLISTSNLRKHIIRHSENPVNCKICDAKCKNTESLRGHMFYQHKCTPDTFVCEECGKKFRTRCKFNLHQNKQHIGVRNFKCDTCGKGFFTNAYLNSHINMTHKKLRPHVCEFCGTGYSSTYALKTHKRQHTNEKPFTCQFCPEGFRQKISLRSHLKSKHGYEEVQKVFCGKCGKGFATSYALNIHDRLHMSVKCNHCSESFASEYLKKHLLEVHKIES